MQKHYSKNLPHIWKKQQMTSKYQMGSSDPLWNISIYIYKYFVSNPPKFCSQQIKIAIRKGHPVLSPVMSLAMSLVMSCQMVRRQLKDKFRVIWDRNTQTKQGEHTHTHRHTFNLKCCIFSLVLSHADTWHTSHRLLSTHPQTQTPDIYHSNPQYSIHLSQIMWSNLFTCRHTEQGHIL